MPCFVKCSLLKTHAAPFGGRLFAEATRKDCPGSTLAFLAPPKRSQLSSLQRASVGMSLKTARCRPNAASLRPLPRQTEGAGSLAAELGRSDKAVSLRACGESHQQLGFCAPSFGEIVCFRGVCVQFASPPRCRAVSYALGWCYQLPAVCAFTRRAVLFLAL